ncbi:hypothetical protein [Polaromonas sp.]|uniref:hypothetical protein n=1 Tax=Polaromonas sp. TaxID=1869339 RepID=UPI0037523E48
MAFSDDSGGFAFACEDAKISICASTWSTRLSQLGLVQGPVFVMTGALPGHDYISRIIGKRPQNIFIIANSNAELEAKALKLKFPTVRIVLHKNNNAKVVLVSPATVWVSSSDFGETRQIQSAVGIHSASVYNRTLDTLFRRVWDEGTEVS